MQQISLDLSSIESFLFLCSSPYERSQRDSGFNNPSYFESAHHQLLEKMCAVLPLLITILTSYRPYNDTECLWSSVE